MINFKYVGIGAGAVVLLGGSAATGAAVASGPVSSGVVHACYHTAASSTGSHSVVLENAGHACPSGYTAASWNEKGQTGASGPRGSTGPQGPLGPGVQPQIVHAVSDLGSPSAVAVCPGTTRVTGGGFSVNGAAAAGGGTPQIVNDFAIEANGSLVPNAWEVATTPVSSTSTISAFAVCTS